MRAFPGLLQATRLLLLGERATSEQLYELGLVSHLLPAVPAFEAEARRFLVENVLSLPPNVCSASLLLSDNDKLTTYKYCS